MNRRIAFPVLFNFMFFIGTFSFPLFAQEDVSTALYEEGVRKYILEDYTGALEDFEGALQLQPGNERIVKMYLNTLIKQGNREYKAGNLKGAEQYFLRAYNLSGGDEKLKANLETIRSQLKLEEERQQTAGAPAKKDEPERKQTVQLPFDMEVFIQQQNEQSRLLLDQMAETQRQERESLLRSIEENKQRLDESFESQREERNMLYRNLAETRNSFDESLRVQQEERANLLQNLEENRDIFDQNIEAQRQERMALFTRIEENQRTLDESMRAQQDEREKLLQSLMEMSRAQREDRRMFSRTLMILVGGSVLIALFVLFGFVMLLRRRTIPANQAVYFEPHAALGPEAKTLLEYGDAIDETKHLTDNRHEDAVRAKRLRELYAELQEGHTSWEGIQQYLGELNHEVKEDILNLVEEKLKSGEVRNQDSVIDILLPLITDEDRAIGPRSRSLVAGLTRGRIQAAALEGPEESSGALSYSALLQFARMSDAKTGRLDHSVRVADIAFKMAVLLKDPALAPDEVRRIGLAHDIGYLELDDHLLRKEGRLTERQFNIIKTHAVCGLHLLQHVDLPEIFSDGIRYHHERLDGSGYPEGLKAKSIPKIARLLGLADFFDAVTSARPHRPAMTVGSCLKMIGTMAGEAFDRELYKIMTELYEGQNG